MFPRAEDPLLTLIDSLYGSRTPIEDQEKRGQGDLVGSEVLPKKINMGTREQFEEMGIVGKDSWHEEKGKLRSMVNMTKLSMLHHGAILQLVDRLLSVEEENRKLMGVLAGAGLLPVAS